MLVHIFCSETGKVAMDLRFCWLTICYWDFLIAFNVRHKESKMYINDDLSMSVGSRMHNRFALKAVILCVLLF
jgi:hypothetical protein